MLNMRLGRSRMCASSEIYSGMSQAAPLHQNGLEYGSFDSPFLKGKDVNKAAQCEACAIQMWFMKELGMQRLGAITHLTGRVAGAPSTLWIRPVYPTAQQKNEMKYNIYIQCL
jgi:hypothetical protein